MKVAMFYHSLVSDWNHGNAHFLRGVVRELLRRGHDVTVWEPEDGWSRANLVAENGIAALDRFRARFPDLSSRTYDPASFEPAAALEGADLVLVHEWNEPALVAAIGRHRAAQGGYRLLFHDTHHRAITAPAEMARYDLRHYDAVLAFGAVIARLYLERGWAAQAFTWHEAADTALFAPAGRVTPRRDLVWIGNWGDDERTRELHEFLLEPVRELGLAARVHGVRYPAEALAALAAAGIEYAGWIANGDVPEAFAAARATVHVPRRPYASALPGIPTIRVFEALACGIPLVSAPWDDAEGLFRPGQDFLVARDGAAMTAHLRLLLHDRDVAVALARSGRERILARHTCAHRVDELFSILRRLGGEEA